MEEQVFENAGGYNDHGVISLQDRKRLAENGMVVVSLSVSPVDGRLLSEPDVIVRGLLDASDTEAITRDLKDVAKTILEDCSAGRAEDITALNSVLEAALGEYLSKKTKRNPVILPVIKEI